MKNKQWNRSKTLAVASLLFAASIFGLPAHAALIGDTINATGGGSFGISPASATIGAGVEFTSVSGFVNFDFGVSTLMLTENAGGINWTGPVPGPLAFVFSGFDDIITGFSIASNTGFSLSNSTFTSNSLTVDLGFPGGASAGAVLIFDIALAAPNAVPEPGSMVLVGLGLLH